MSAAGALAAPTGRSVISAALGSYGQVMGPWLADMVATLGADLVLVGEKEEPPPGSQVLLSLSVDRPTIERCLTPDVNWIHVLATGVDGFPFELVEQRTLTCSRGASAVAIAEFVLACMLAFEKHLPQTWITEPPARWNMADLGGLAGRTLGLVGLGAIGTEIARRALAFDMTITALRRTSAPPPLAGIDVTTSLEELLAVADHVVVAAPATPATRHLIDRAALRALKPGAHFVNIARGSLVDQEALIEALDTGIIAMASLDVVDPEPLAAGHPLYSHPSVRLSPHVSWSSPTTMRLTFELFVENLGRYRAGEPMVGLVDVAAGY